MKLNELDIVYVVKDSAYNDELRYSLRSVEKNFPHNRVWVYGGKPIGVHPDKQVPVVQNGRTKWDRVRELLGTICENKEITDKFVLFNDDFFVLEPVKELPFYAEGTLEDLAKHITDVYKRMSPYVKKILDAAKLLKEKGCTTYNFELHIPMVIDKDRMLATRDEFPGAPASRSMFGNYNNVKPHKFHDNKIVNLTDVPKKGQVFVSTEDMSFKEGAAGRYIKGLFPERSRFEVRH